MSLLKYKYYDTPEGQDIWKKVFVTSKYAALSGLGMATFDVLMFSHPKGFVSTVARYGWWMGPLVGMAGAFTVTANVAQNVRGKNDQLNYFLGGVAAGSIFGAWSKSFPAAVPMALILGFGAMTKKASIEEGWEFFPDTTLATNSAISVRRDFTMAKDIPEYKGWTTVKQ